MSEIVGSPLDRTPRALPLRIVPARKVQYVVLALLLFGVAILGYALTRQFADDWRLRATQSPVVFALFTAFLILALLSVTGSLIASLLRLVPGSPLFHLALTWDAIAIRRPLGTRRFAWSDLGTFTVTTAPNDYEANYIVAGRADGDTGNRDDKDRYRRAIFRLRSDPYCGSADAELLARWLNEIRSAVAGREPCDIVFFAPSALSGNLIAGADDSAAGVIERRTS